MRLLRAPRLDLLQIHNLLDWRTHAATLRALKSEEKIRYTGVTHYTASAYADLEAALRAEPFDFAQFNYSIATREAERRLLPFCQERGVAVLINRPFEEGDSSRTCAIVNYPPTPPSSAAAAGRNSFSNSSFRIRR